MYKHILLPTDGSKLSDKAVERGIAFAKSIGAKVTAIHVVPEFQMVADEGFVAPMSAQFKERFEKESRIHAKKVLDTIEKMAKAADVGFSGEIVSSDFPHQQIIHTAQKRKCDLVMMASHGRRGLSGLLLGSETAKVLTHSKIPVLVVR